MKKIALLLLLVTTVSYSQIKKVKTVKKTLIGKLGSFGMPVNMKCEKANNTYIFTYKDFKYSHIVDYKSFSFDDVDNAFEDFYNILIDGIKNPPKEDVILKLPNDTLHISFTKSLGVVNIKIYHFVNDNPNVIGETLYLTKKRIMKLFGKKKKK